MIDIGLGSAAAKLTDKILGYNNDDVVDIMSDIAQSTDSPILLMCDCRRKRAMNPLCLRPLPPFQGDGRPAIFSNNT